MGKILRHSFLALTLAVTIIACNDEDITLQPNNRVAPDPATEITSSSAVLKCKVWSNDPRHITECGFQYAYINSAEDSLRITEGQDWSGLWNKIIATFDMESGDSMMVAKLDYLQENTLIFYRAYIYSNGKYKFSKTSCFRTNTLTIVPKTLNATQIGTNSVRLNGKIETNDPNNIYSFSFFISNNQDEVLDHSSFSRFYSNDYHQGTFFYDVDYLQPNTTYYYQTVISYYDNNGYLIDLYGDIYSFTTKSLDANQIKTGDYKFIKKTTVELLGSIQAEIHGMGTTYFIISSAKDTFTDNDINHPNNETMTYNAYFSENADFYSNDIEYILHISELSQNTTYYYAICFYMNEDYYFGETKSFTTGSINLKCNDASNITAHSALLSGSYNDDSIYCYRLGFILSSTTNEPSFDDNESIIAIDSYETIKVNEFSATASGLKANTTYYYRPYISSEDGTFYGETMSFTTTNVISIDGTVDLGLSVLWATDNLGATKNNIIGNYYAWGETTSKNTFFINGYSIPDIEDIANSQYDVATATLGKGWRMPTIQEICELTEQCNSTVAIKDDTKGIKLTSLTTGQSVFIPFSSIKSDDMEQVNLSAYFWTSNKCDPKQAYYADINDNVYIRYQPPYVETFAYYGLPIRPVYDPNIK